MGEKAIIREQKIQAERERRQVVLRAERLVTKQESVQQLRKVVHEQERRIKQLQTDRDREAKRFAYKICLISCVLELYLCLF